MFRKRQFTDIQKMQELESLLETETLEPTKVKGLASRTTEEEPAGSGGFIKTLMTYMKEGYENNKPTTREEGTIPAVDLANRLRKARSSAATQALPSQLPQQQGPVDAGFVPEITPVEGVDYAVEADEPKVQRKGLMSRAPEPRPDDLNLEPGAPSGDPDRELNAFIKSGESSGGAGYDTVYSGATIAPPKPLTEMTVSEVRSYQDRVVNAGSDSSAMGAFQIIRGTMDQLIKEGAISPDDTFNAETQRKAYNHLLEKRGYSTFKTAMSQAETEEERVKAAQRFQMNLAKEFASVPIPYAVTRTIEGKKVQLRKGDSFYKGIGNNKALHTSDGFLGMLLREF